MDSVGAGTFRKPLLIELSHTIEQFAVSVDPDTPTVVIALFQKLAYFRREAEMYRRMAERGVVTVVGLAEETAPELPPGVRHVLVPAADDLEREWSVTVLSPEAGATLVAADLETLEPDAPTLEQGRTFRAGWSFRRQEAFSQVHRLRAKLRLDPATLADVDAVLDTVTLTPEPVFEEAWDRSLVFLSERLDHAVRARAAAVGRLDALEDSHERDPHTGVLGPASLDRWLAGSASGTMPVGLVLLRVPGLVALRARYGRRGELAVLKGLATGMAELVGPGDRVVALGSEEFLLVLPSATEDDVLRQCRAAGRCADGIAGVYPFVALPSLVAGTVTRVRPLPLERLREHATPARGVGLVPA
jgi:DICT domain-containing protein